MIPLTGIEKSFTITDFWRWWVVHLWVEQSFEFFAVAMSAYLLMSLGLVSRKLAERSVYLELILIFLGGVLGTGHHLYWGGGPSMWVPLGSMFSFIEVLPLVLLILEAISQHRLIKGAAAFDYGLAYLYILGLGVLEFRRRRRVRRRHAQCAAGQLLRARHLPDAQPRPHLAVRRVRAAGARADLLLPALPRRARTRSSTRRPGRIAFWCYNGGLVMWIFLHFFPIGWPQLNAVYEHGFAWARSQAFYDQYSVLAVDAHARRRRVLGRRADHGLGFPDEAAAAARGAAERPRCSRCRWQPNSSAETTLRDADRNGATGGVDSRRADAGAAQDAGWRQPTRSCAADFGRSSSARPTWAVIAIALWLCELAGADRASNRLRGRRLASPRDAVRLRRRGGRRASC